MGDRAALQLALDLLNEPWGVRVVRERPLPDGMPLLLGVAAGDPASEEAAVEAFGRPPEVVRQAAGFFIEQILLSPGADCYRVLGASSTATSGELRHNMALIMRWLHPDIARQGEQAVFAARIASAWNTLKTPDRRAAYDSERQSARVASEARLRGGVSRSGRSRRSGGRAMPRSSRLVGVLAFLLGKPRH